MSDLQATLAVCSTKLETNLKNIELALQQATAANAALDPDVRTAAEFLIEKLEHVNGAAQVLESIYKEKAYAETKAELEAMLSVVKDAVS